MCVSSLRRGMRTWSCSRSKNQKENENRATPETTKASFASAIEVMWRVPDLVPRRCKLRDAANWPGLLLVSLCREDGCLLSLTA